MNRYSLDYYRHTEGKMKLSEVFLGYQSYNWACSEVDYTADRTEALPLTIFDRAICGILALDGALSPERIGEILGMNVVFDPDSMRYADSAEQELLMDSLRSLESFKMIEQDMYSGKFRLTQIGREYSAGGRKFKTTDNYGFKVFFDMVTGNHAKAKEVFEYISGSARPVVPDEDSAYGDEAALKSFIQYQVPEIFDQDKGNSFTNLRVKAVKEKACKVYFSVLYDVQERTYRLIGYIAGENGEIKESEFLTEAAALNSSLRDEIVTLFTSHQEQLGSVPSDVQETFEQVASDAQGMYDFNIYSKEDTEPVVEAFKKDRQLFEQERFWTEPTRFIDDDVKKVFFNFGELSEPMLISLQKLANDRPDLYMFVLYRSTDQEFPDHSGRTFFFKAPGKASGIFCCAEGLRLEFADFVLPGEAGSAVSMVYRNLQADIKLDRIETNFASVFVPRLYQETMEYLDLEFEGKKGDVEAVASCDESLMVFRDYINEDKLSALTERKLEVYNQVKLKNEDKLLEILAKFKDDCDVEEVNKLDLIIKWKERLSSLGGGVDATYVRFNEAVSEFRAVLSEREQFIKDELMAKTFIFDTNALLDHPDIVNKIAKRDRVVIPLMVYEELEKLKSKLTEEEGRENARIARKNIDTLRKKGKRLSIEKGKFNLLPAELQLNRTNPDNLILAVAIAHLDANPYMVTDDGGLQSKSAVEGIASITPEELESKIETESDAKKPAVGNSDRPQEQTRTYLQVYYDLKKDGKPVTVQKYEKALKKAAIDFRDSGYSTFEEYCRSLPEFRVKSASNGFTYVNLK